ncbi:MAG TPA: Gldg family protein, partial [Candidatus Limnocylindria bacterium]|nr:Gldg family protein [Candidatus Limnocylindria bacterium]
YTLSGARYEAAIAEALLYLTSDSVPRAQFLTGHGELGPEETGALEALLRESLFEVSRLDLARGGVPDPDALLFILSPQRDLSAGELRQITDFAQAGGAMLVTSDYGDPDSLPNFDALYRSLGFARKPGIVIADVDDAAAYADNPLFLTPYMGMTEPTAPLIGAGQTLLRLPGARAFEAVDAQDAVVSPLLMSGFSYIKPVARAEATLSREGGEEEGQFNLALLADKAHANGNRTRAAVLGNSAILTDSWLHEVTYAAQFTRALADYLSPMDTIALDIPPKALVRPQLSIPAPWVPVLLIVLLPLSVTAAGAVLLVRRERRGHAAR